MGITDSLTSKETLDESKQAILRRLETFIEAVPNALEVAFRSMVAAEERRASGDEQGAENMEKIPELLIDAGELGLKNLSQDGLRDIVLILLRVAATSVVKL